MNLKKKRSSIFWLSVLSYFLAVAPMAIPVLTNLEYYTSSGWKTSGVVMFLAIIICLIALKDKFSGLLKHNAQLKLTVFLLVFVEITAYIKGEIEMLLIFSAIGAALALIPQYFISKLKRIVDKGETAEINAGAMQEAISNAIKDYTGGGRV